MSTALFAVYYTVLTKLQVKNSITEKNPLLQREYNNAAHFIYISKTVIILTIHNILYIIAKTHSGYNREVVVTISSATDQNRITHPNLCHTVFIREVEVFLFYFYCLCNCC